MTRLLALAAAPLLLGGCGEYLGAYRATDVRLVRDMPSMHIPEGSRLPYPNYLRVTLESRFNLHAAKTGPGLYVDADFCPLRNSHAVIAFGPEAGDHGPVDNTQRPAKYAPDVSGTGYRYFVYVMPRTTKELISFDNTGDIQVYDLARSNDDLCLRFFVPGYNIVPSRSSTVRVPADRLRRAMSRAAARPR